MHSRTTGCRKANECASAGQKTIETKTRSYDDRHLARVREQAAWLSRRRRRWCRRGALPVVCLVRARGVERVDQKVLVVSIDRLLPVLRSSVCLLGPASPGYRLGERAFWDGHEVLLVAVGKPQIGRPPSPGRLLYAYSPTTNRWRQLASMPSGRSQFAAVWDGKRLLVWGGAITAANVPQNPPTGTAYNPRTNRWSPLPRATLRPRLGPTAVWTGRTMIVWGGWTIGTRYFTDGAAFTPTAP
jgi:hypothetical protein